MRDCTFVVEHAPMLFFSAFLLNVQLLAEQFNAIEKKSAGGKEKKGREEIGGLRHFQMFFPMDARSEK